MRRIKLNDRVTFPLHLDLNPFINGKAQPPSKPQEEEEEEEEDESGGEEPKERNHNHDVDEPQSQSDGRRGIFIYCISYRK